MTAISDRILRRARGASARDARVFTPKDFYDLGSRAAIDQALSRLAKDGKLRRIGRGFYDIPRKHPMLGRPAAPDIDAVADAIARRDNVTIVPNPLVSANRLGLTTAVPSKTDYLTDGASRTIDLDGRTLRLRHAGPKLMALKDKPAGDVVRALHWLGRDMAGGDDIVRKLRRKLPPRVKDDLVKARPAMTAWAADIAGRIAA
ncbi:MAG: DUF6088 family protein [Pseudomonadota bacterium]